MAVKRRQPRSATPRKRNCAYWTSDARSEMLAWLDYCRTESTDLNVFRNSVVVHLKQYCNKQFTLAQIDNKLKSLWNDKGFDDALDDTEIYTEGTQCLRYLEPEIKADIQARVVRLKDEDYVARVHRLQSPRQTRSEYRKSPAQAVCHISLGVEGSSRSSPRQRRHEVLRSESATESLSLIRKSDSKDTIGLVKLETPKRQIWDIASRNASTNLPSIADSEELSSLSEDFSTPTPGNLGENPISPCERLSATEVENSPRPESQRVQTTTLSSDDEQNATAAEGQSSTDTSCECDNLRSQLYAVRIEREEETRFFRDQLSQGQERIQDLTQKIDCADATYAILSRAGKDSLEKILFEQQLEMENLQAKLADRKFLRPFSTLASNRSVPFDIEEVRDQMALIGRRLQNIMIDDELQETCAAVDPRGHEDLEILFRRSFGLSKLHVFGAFSRAFLSQITLQFLVRSLVSSALCEWLFESDLGEFSAVPCQLLETYRSHLAKLDGQIALRNLDFAAHHSIIEQKHFQEYVIPRKVSALADRLLETLASLFAKHKPLDEWKIDVLRKWRKERRRLTEIFDAALKIKLKTLLSKDLFEVVLYPPGTAYSKATMKAENLEEEFADKSSHKKLSVLLSLVPSLGVHVHDRKLVDYNSFAPGNAGQGRKADLITKAVVVVGEG